MFIVLFFKQKTAYEMRISDWSSDVCSSDLQGDRRREKVRPRQFAVVLVQLPQQRRHARHPDRATAQDRLAPAHRLARCVEEAIEIGRASCRERVCQYV